MLHFYKAFAQGMTLEEQDAAVRAADLRVPNGTWPHALSAEDIEILAIGAAKELSATFPVPLPPQENILSRLFTPKPIKLLFVSHDPLSRAHIYRVKNPIDSLHRIGVQADWIPAVEAKCFPCYSGTPACCSFAALGMITSHESSRIVTGRESQSDTTSMTIFSIPM